MLAQSLVEYSLVSTLSERIQHTTYSVQAWLGSLSSTEWAAAGAAVLLVLVLRSRRRSS